MFQIIGYLASKIVKEKLFNKEYQVLLVKRQKCLIPIYADLSVDLKSYRIGDIVEISGEIVTYLLTAKNKKKYLKMKLLLNSIKCLEKDGEGRILDFTYLAKLLALEDITKLM